MGIAKRVHSSIYGKGSAAHAAVADLLPAPHEDQAKRLPWELVEGVIAEAAAAHFHQILACWRTADNELLHIVHAFERVGWEQLGEGKAELSGMDPGDSDPVYQGPVWKTFRSAFCRWLSSYDCRIIVLVNHRIRG